MYNKLKVVLFSINIIFNSSITSLDKFVKRISTKPEVESFIPKQKDIDLKAPILKSKGIIKRENKKENINK